jgi:hypothetical protein
MPTYKLKYDNDLDNVWEGIHMNIKFGEVGWMVGHVDDAFHLISENSPELVKMIYAAFSIPTDMNVGSLPTVKIGGSQFITVPVDSPETADTIFFLWAKAMEMDENLVAATHYIMDKLYE